MTLELPKTIIVPEQESLEHVSFAEILDNRAERQRDDKPIPVKAWIIMTPQTKATFFARLEWQKEIQLFDADGYVVLDETRRAKITLYSGVYHGHYRAIKVQIISKTHGTIDEKTFWFKDYLDFSKKISVNPHYEGQFEAMHTHPKGFDWYMHKPETTRPLCAAIEAWIDLYK